MQSIDHDNQHSARLPANVPEDARRRITEALDQSLAPTTRANYRAQWKQWVAFATENDYPAFPSDPVHVADWITQRAADGRKPGTIRMGLAAVSAAHRRVNLLSPYVRSGGRRGSGGYARYNQNRQQGAETSCRVNCREPGCDSRELISEVVEIEKAQVRERAYPPGITNRR